MQLFISEFNSGTECFVPPAIGGPQIDDSRLTVHPKSPELSFGYSLTSSVKLPCTVALQSLCVAQPNKEGTHPILPFLRLRTVVGREVESVF